MYGISLAGQLISQERKGLVLPLYYYYVTCAAAYTVSLVNSVMTSVAKSTMMIVFEGVWCSLWPIHIWHCGFPILRLVCWAIALHFELHSWVQVVQVAGRWHTLSCEGTEALSPGCLWHKEGPGNHCHTHAPVEKPGKQDTSYPGLHHKGKGWVWGLVRNSLIPGPSLSRRRPGYEVPGFHGMIGACACSGYQALFRVREGLRMRLKGLNTIIVWSGMWVPITNIIPLGAGFVE